MGRSRSSGSSHSHTWSNTSGYSDKPQNSSRWYFWSKPAGNGYNGAYVDPDKPSRVPQREKSTQHDCERHLKRYEEFLLTFGIDSWQLTTGRMLLIDECGAYFDLDKPSSVPEKRRYRPTKYQCKLHLQKFEELVQKFGRDSSAATTNRKLLIDKCGLPSDFDKPSCRS